MTQVYNKLFYFFGSLEEFEELIVKKFKENDKYRNQYLNEIAKVKILFGLNEIGSLISEHDRGIYITTKRNETSAILMKDNKISKHTVAKCHPDDEFSFQTGAQIAFERLFKEGFKPHL